MKTPTLAARYMLMVAMGMLLVIMGHDTAATAGEFLCLSLIALLLLASILVLVFWADAVDRGGK